MFAVWTVSRKHLSIVVAAIQCAVSAVDATQLYHGRHGHTAIIVGNRLYIDGGEITTWTGTGSGIQDGWGVQDNFSCYGGGTCAGNITILPDNSTYSINLTASWTNQTVTLNTIQKTVPVLNGAGVWLDAEGKVFYSYNGGTSWSQAAFFIPEPPENTLYQFTPSGDEGSWSEAALPAQTNFSTLSRATGSAYAYGNGLGFALGGQQQVSTDYAISTSDTFTIPGLVLFNSSSGQWFNRSSSGYSGDSNPFGGSGLFVPSFGSEGLFFVFGGQVVSSTETHYVDTGSINMYDPISDQWKLQTVTGTPPPPSTGSCVVGAQGDNNTYEVYFFGGSGSDISTNMDLDNVYVLTLPAFNWQQVTHDAQTARSSQTCNALGSQMIVVGGIAQNRADYEANADKTYVGSPDPWSQGIGVFDLNQLQWKDGYDADAPAYSTPELIKSYYASNSRYPDSLLQDPVLSKWFKAADTQSSSNTTAPAPAPPSQSHKSKSNAGAIAGGVVGGIALIVIIALIFWAVARSRRRRRNQAGEKAVQPTELPDTYKHRPIAEANGASIYEAGGRQLHEKRSRQMIPVEAP